MDYGIKLNTYDYAEMSQEVQRRGVFVNGNLTLLARGDLITPFMGMLNGDTHCILGAGRPAEGEALSTLMGIIQGRMIYSLVSYESLKEENKNVDYYRDRNNFSLGELGTLRQYNLTGNEVWRENKPSDLVLASLFIKNVCVSH